MKSKATVKDVAAAAGVSVATVSRVLNGNYYVSPDVENRVRQAIDALGYVQNSIARSLKMNSTHMIGYVVSDISNTYHISAARAAEDILRKDGYSMILCSTENSQEREHEYLNLLIGKNVDALVLNTTGKNDSYIVKLSKNMPIMLVNRKITHPEFTGDFVDTNGYEGCYHLTKLLLNIGHRKIYVLHGPQHLSNSQERLSGFKAAMQEAGIPVDASYPYQFAGSFTLQSGIDAIDALCSMEDKPTAIMSQNNMMTIGALKGLKAKNISIPEELSLVAYDGIDNLDLMTTRPTVANFDTTVIGSRIATMLLERIRDPSMANRQFILEPEIIQGNSIGLPTNLLNQRRL